MMQRTVAGNANRDSAPVVFNVYREGDILPEIGISQIGTGDLVTVDQKLICEMPDLDPKPRSHEADTAVLLCGMLSKAACTSSPGVTMTVQRPHRRAHKASIASCTVSTCGPNARAGRLPGENPRALLDRHRLECQKLLASTTPPTGRDHRGMPPGCIVGIRHMGNESPGLQPRAASRPGGSGDRCHVCLIRQHEPLHYEDQAITTGAE